MQLEPGALVMTSTMRAFDGLLIRHTAVNRASLHRLRVPPHSVSLLISSSRYAAQFVDGCKLTRDRCVILQEGAELELIAHPESSWMLISLERRDHDRRNRAARIAIDIAACRGMVDESVDDQVDRPRGMKR